LNILVTGGAGYIGSHTAKALSKAGHHPVVFDNLSRGHKWAVKWGPFVKADLSNIADIEKAFVEYEIEAVIHFAASAYVGESMKNPYHYFNNNVVNSLNLLQAMHNRKVKKIVFSSSCATYGLPISLPISETHPTMPVNPYGESKLMVEKMIRWYGDIFDFNWIALRYFNAVGADPDGELGEIHIPETHLIPLAIEAALDHSKELSVYGTDYPTNDGSAVRDYVHVSDLANAHLTALESINSHGGQIFNLGTGNGVSVFEIIKIATDLSGKSFKPSLCARRQGDPAVLIADVSKAKKMLGWEPRYSEISFCLQTALDWVLKVRQIVNIT